jgi:hypothetical protein
MKKILISIFIIVTLITIVIGCSKKENIQFDTFYGETEKWLVIRTNDNVFQFMYKGNTEDLKKNNNNGKIDFHYGTSLGSTRSTQLLNNSNYYQIEFKEDFVTELPSNSTFNGNKFINVKISYADTTDSIDLAAYLEYKVN